MKRFKGFSLLLLVSMVFTVLFAPLTVLANESTDVSTVSKIQNNAIKNSMSGTSSGMDESIANAGDGTMEGAAGIPETTIEDANQWVADKGNDLVGLGGTLAEPIAIIGFMLGLFITLLGGFTKSSVLSKGLLVMAISIIVYVGVAFAPELIHYFSSWLAN